VKIRLARSVVSISALLIILILAATPSFADAVPLYTNGPIKGTYNAWNIGDGAPSVVADSFTLSSASTITSFSAGLWSLGGFNYFTVPATISWRITTAPFGTAVSNGSGTGTLTSDFLWNLSLGPNVWSIYNSSLAGLNVDLGAGTYYLELSSASSLNGRPYIFWDINNGSSAAYGKGIGNLKDLYLMPGTNSGAFNIYGTTDSPTHATPEPGTMLMFGTGVLGLFGAVRRRFSF